MRQQKLSTAGAIQKAEVGTSGEKGLNFNRIHQVDLAQIPGGHPQVDLREMAVTGGHFETDPPQAEGAVGAALRPGELSGERQFEFGAGWARSADFAMMEIAAHFPALETMFGGLSALTVERPTTRALAQTVAFHVTENRLVGRGLAQLRPLFQPGGQIVRLELVAPTGVLAVLGQEPLSDGRTEGRVLTLIGADFAAQGLHRVPLFMAGGVIPALDGGEAKLDPLARDGVAPFLGRQPLELFLELSPFWRGRQQRADDAEAKAGPLLVRAQRFGILRHRVFHFFRSPSGRCLGSTALPICGRPASCAGPGSSLTSPALSKPPEW